MLVEINSIQSFAIYRYYSHFSFERNVFSEFTFYSTSENFFYLNIAQVIVHINISTNNIVTFLHVTSRVTLAEIKESCRRKCNGRTILITLRYTNLNFHQRTGNIHANSR